MESPCPTYSRQVTSRSTRSEGNFCNDIVHLKLVSHISPRVDISVSKTVQMISIQRGWGPRDMVWCQNETNLDVVG